MRGFLSYWIWAVAVSVLALNACTREGMPDLPADGKVRVEFRLPSYFGDMGGVRSTGGVADDGARSAGGPRCAGGVPTRADELNPLRDLESMKPGIQAYPLAAGTTLWLTYSEKNENGEFTSPDLQAYQVKNTGGYNALYPCSTVLREGTDKYGKDVTFVSIDTSTVSTPLFLSPGTYKFKMISPAMEIIQEVADDGSYNWKLPIDNDMYFCSTDGRYRQTVAGETVIHEPDLSDNSNFIQYVTLNPMVHQTVKMDFRIIKGEHVDSLSILPAGVEISGLQNPGLNAHYYWASENIADTLVMKMGDKRSWTTLRPEGFRVDNAYRWDEDKDQVIQKDEVFPGTLVGDIGVLPTDSRSTTVIITFNLLVNGIPTQYVATLNEIILAHGHSYVMNLKVWKEDGITLFTWQYQSWTGNLELD